MSSKNYLFGAAEEFTNKQVEGARTEFRYGSARVAELMPVYDQTPRTPSCGYSIPKTALRQVTPPAWPRESLRASINPAPL